MDKKETLGTTAIDANLRLPKLRAIILQIEAGRELQKLHPEIAKDYREGLFASQIVEKYNLEQELDISHSSAIGAVGYALRGYKNHVNERYSYPGLIGYPDISNLRIQRRKTIGSLRYEDKIGFFGWDKNKLKKFRSKGGCASGKIVGAKMRDEKKGIFAMTLEQLTEAARLGTKKAAEARGQFIWTEEQRSRVYELMQLPEYQGRGSIHKIQDTINNEFYGDKPIRNYNSIAVVVSRLRRGVKR